MWRAWTRSSVSSWSKATRTSILGAAQVTTVAKEVFAAMVDGQAGFLTSSPAGSVSLADPLHVWVDMDTEPPGRVQVIAEASTADDLTRAFLHMDAAENVTEADVADAFGEIVNIMGGNMKALLPRHVQLTMPEVSRQSPSGAGALRLLELPLAWRGRPVVITLRTI